MLAKYGLLFTVTGVNLQEVRVIYELCNIIFIGDVCISQCVLRGLLIKTGHHSWSITHRKVKQSEIYPSAANSLPLILMFSIINKTKDLAYGK